MKTLVLALLFAATAGARPAITAVSPNEGPAAGGTIVTITGSGFALCEPCTPRVPPRVLFGGTPAREVALVNANTLRVVAPAHLPKTVTVTVQQLDGFATAAGAFTYTGTVEEGFERVLLPIFAHAEGAFASQFYTNLRAANPSSTEPAAILGLQQICIVTCIGFDALEQPYELEPGESHTPEYFTYSGRPGMFVYLPKDSPRAVMNLRVFDESRRALNFGTEIPVVGAREFTTDRIRLLGVPRDSRFRNTLRIYAAEGTSVTVTFDNTAHLVDLRPGETILDPAYAQFSDFPGGAGTFDVTVTPSGTVPVWTFISVTNNETQLITTITPQR